MMAQPVIFRKLSIKDGLNASSFWYTTLDRDGYIWMSSLDGLFMYDGYQVQHITQETDPGLPSNLIGYLHCDSRNRIWIQTNGGVAMIDENRDLHTIEIPGYPSHESLDRLVFEAPGVGMVAVTPSGCFRSPDGKQEWKPYPWLTEVLQQNGVVDVRPFDDDSRLLCIRSKRVLLINFKEQRVVLDFPLPRAMGVSRLTDTEILAGTDGNWGLFRINIPEKKIVQSFPAPIDKSGNPLLSGVVMITTAADSLVYISTRRNGLVRFHPATGMFDQYSHETMNENSVSSNGLRMVISNDAGLLVISSPNGINFTNVKYSMLQQRVFFRKKGGGIIEAPVNGVVSNKPGQVFLTTSAHVLSWNRKTDECTILPEPTGPQNTSGGISVPAVPELDTEGNLWVGYTTNGIAVYNPEGRLIRHLTKELPSLRIRVIRRLENGQLMVGAEDGFFLVNPRTFAIAGLTDHPLLDSLSKKRIIDVYPEKGRVWLAASPAGGVYRYDFLQKELKVFNEKNGLHSQRVYCLTADKLGNTYAGSREGLFIIDSQDIITHINKRNGLLNGGIESIETDNNGHIWFANNNNICRYDPETKNLSYFDEHNGVNNVSFGIESSHKSGDGTLYFGTGRGLLFFQPRDTRFFDTPVKLFLTHTADGNRFERCKPGSTLEFDHNSGKIEFQVSGSDIISNQQLYYQYRLEGLDTGWSAPTRTRTIAYNLQPGRYRFMVQASRDRVNTLASTDIVHIVVRHPFWQTWAFRACTGLFILALLYRAYTFRIASLQKKAGLQQQLSELEAKALRAQMNPHFIFNSLNAIQECIVTGQTDAAFEYLSKFSRMLRLVLNNSEKNFISLNSELEMIRLYLSLESLRFRQSFSYSIEVDESIEADELQVPPLLVQPYVENAVWHGLRTKQGEKRLSIRVLSGHSGIGIEIEDNGIGREKAAAARKQQLGEKQFASRGTALSQQRITLLNRQYQKKADVETADLVGPDGAVCGTKVTIRLPLYSNPTVVI